ncbi:MAG: translation initiation factor IF-3 [Thermodesulfobacteriota bacterium]
MAKDRTRTNSLIKVSEVRVVDVEGNQLGVMKTPEALHIAEDAGLDLVEVAPQAKPPVCRIMDYGKYKYQMSKRAREARKKQTVINIKEIKLRPKTDEHDFLFKERNAKRFLESGDRVRFFVFFRGREIVHKNIGENMLKRIVEDLKEVGNVEAPPRMEGRKMTMLLAPVQLKEKRA